MSIIKIKLPDIGDFTDVAVIEVLVEEGIPVSKDESLITIESDKAAMEIPCPQDGRIQKLMVAVGDKVSQGDVIATLEAVESEPAQTDPVDEGQSSQAEPSVPTANTVSTDAEGTMIETQVVVLGSGPGGYTAAFRAADLGLNVVLVERYPILGGVCLNVGCIPSKALLHTAEVLEETKHYSAYGVDFGEPTIDLDVVRQHKEDVVAKLTGGLKVLAKQRKVRVVQGTGTFVDPHHLAVSHEGNTQTVQFEHAIIAAGSQVTKLPFIPWDDPRVMDSTDALELNNIPKRLLIVGAGIIGLEMATVYHALGSEISLVELGPDVMPGPDRDTVAPFKKAIKKRYSNIWTNTKLTQVEAQDEALVCHFEGDKAPESQEFDRILVAIGRQPNGQQIDAGRAGVFVENNGFIPVDEQMRTNVEHIFAIGDIVGQPMLAHKATHEGKVAAEVIAGQKSYFDARTIPSVAYTNPEVAWAGKTEAELKAEGIEYDKGVFPWAASGRALSMDAAGGMSKVLFDKHSHQILGAAVCGKNAGELIAEAVLAIEMGADAHDIGLSIHPHPTLSETINFAAEVSLGSCTDIYAPKK